MDGAPYCLAIKLLRSVHICSVCNETVPAEEITVHQNMHGNELPALTRKYKKIVIRPGAGHIEMNMVRNILSFFWTPFIEPFAKILGYKTEAALLYAKRGSDHHKSYNMLMIIHAAISYELIHAYVSASGAANKTPTYVEFCAWDRQHAERNKTYKLAADFALTTLHALQLYRCAIRMCNDKIASAAWERMACQFYITNCPKYQELIAYDTLYLLTLSEADRAHVGIDSALQNKGPFGEGIDLLMESRNKLYKSFLTNEATPTFERWLSVARSTGTLLQVRETASHRLAISTGSNAQRKRKFATEIFEVRKRIRALGLLGKEDLELYSFDEEPVQLDADVLDYLGESVENMKQYITHYLHDKKGHLTTLTISKQDVNFDAANFKVAKEAVCSKISGLKGPSFSFFNNHLKNCKTKEDLISLYKAVQYTHVKTLIWGS